MIKLNIQLFAPDSLNPILSSYKKYYSAKGILYKEIIEIYCSQFEGLEDLSSIDVLTLENLDTGTIIDLKETNNYTWDKENACVLTEAPEDGSYRATVNTNYSTNSFQISNLVRKTDSTKTIQKTSEIITQQNSGPEKVGVIKLFSGSVPPFGWLICDGSAISRTKYKKLFEVIGITYGSGDGETTFNLPDLKGKTVVGLNDSDTSFNLLGKTGGEKTHTLTIAEMPSHTHKPSSSQYGQFSVHSTSTSYGTADLAGGSQAYNAYVNETQPTGDSKAHNNLQPYIVLNYIIKAIETKNLQAQVVDSLEGDSTNSAPSVKAVKSAIKSNYDAIPLGSVLNFKGTEIPEGYEEVYDENEYSTDEKAIGKWIDGKPLYRKVIEKTITKSGNNIFSLSSVGLKNIDKYITLKLISNGNPINEGYYTSASDSLRACINYNGLNINLGTTYPAVPCPIYIIVEYTKTTD